MRKGKKALIIIIILIVLLVVLFNVLKVQNRILKIIYPIKYNNFVELYAKEYQVDEYLVYALIKAESNFNPKAVSGKEAKGLMQLVTSTACDVARNLGLNLTEEEVEEKLLNVDFNINLGTKYLSILLEKYESIELALTAYNAGIGTVDNWIEEGTIKDDGSDVENIPYKETNQYVRKILRDYKIYRELY